MPISLPAATTAHRITTGFQHLSGTLKGTPSARTLSGPVDVRNGAAVSRSGTRLFTRNPALGDREAPRTRLGPQFQKLGNLRVPSAPVPRRCAALKAGPYRDEPHALRLLTREQINTIAPPRASELHPKALMQHARFHPLPVTEPAPAPCRAQGNAETLAALQPSADLVSPQIETVNPACYSQPVRMEACDASEPDDDFDDAPELTDLEKLAAECRFLREEAETRGLTLDSDTPLLHNILLAGESAAASQPVDQMMHQLEQELQMYQAALEVHEQAPPVAMPAMPEPEPAPRECPPANSFHALLADIRSHRRNEPAAVRASSGDVSPASNGITLLFEKGFKNMMREHKESGAETVRANDPGVYSSDSEWD